jgi:hypothetical protein
LGVTLLPGRLPVAGKLPQGDVSPADRNHQTRHVVEVTVAVGAALQLGAEADQGNVDAGDAAAVRDRRQVLRPEVGDAGGVEDQGLGPLAEELGGEAAQMVVLPLPLPVPLQTRMCGAASMSTAMARPSVLMPISAAEPGST